AAADQFGMPLATQPMVVWSTDAGGVGSIDGTGLYSAGAAAGSATVRASVGSISGTATITEPGPVTVSTRTKTAYTELVITGTPAHDAISASQAGNTFTIVSNGFTQIFNG